MSMIADAITTFARTFADEFSRQMHQPSGRDGAWNSTDPQEYAPDTTVGMDCPVCDNLKALCEVQWNTAELIGHREPFDVAFVKRHVVPMLKAQREYQTRLNELTAAVTGRRQARRLTCKRDEMSELFGIDLE